MLWKKSIAVLTPCHRTIDTVPRTFTRKWDENLSNFLFTTYKFYSFMTLQFFYWKLNTWNTYTDCVVIISLLGCNFIVPSYIDRKAFKMVIFVCDLCNGKFKFKYQLVVHLNDDQNGKTINRKKITVEGNGWCLIIIFNCMRIKSRIHVISSVNILLTNFIPIQKTV